MKRNPLHPIAEHRRLPVRRRPGWTVLRLSAGAAPLDTDSAETLRLVIAKDAGGPQDLASYTCECGFFFTAPVSTTVSCPQCGMGQAW